MPPAHQTPPDTPPALGRAVRDMRQARGLTQEELALRSGLHRTYLGGIERGRRNPTVSTLNRLSTALGVRPWELLRRGDELIEWGDS